MNGEPMAGRVFQLFATLLDYPRMPLTGVAGECAALVRGRSPEAASRLRQFESFAEKTALTRLEEIYTGVFELDATCHPYAGYHLFGESYKRSAFLLELKERYRLYNIRCGSELPDHLAVMLRFLAVNEDLTDSEEIIREALHPTLRKMLKNKDDEPPDPDIPKPPARGDEYRSVLQALRSVLLTITADDALPAVEAANDELVLMAA
ncbi:MAG: molecular chaperone TorD family protein [Caldilineaceae bacterium]|nr:molecular chaperone TorD family protein [Caldilineaceae bacterium]